MDLPEAPPGPAPGPMGWRQPRDSKEGWLFGTIFVGDLDGFFGGFHGKTIGKPWENGGFNGKTIGKPIGKWMFTVYPLVMTNSLLLKMAQSK